MLMIDDMYVAVGMGVCRYTGCVKREEGGDSNINMANPQISNVRIKRAKW